MTIEEKAKKYDEALDWMRKVYPALTGADKEDAEHYFPELKESEDERIIRAIIDALYSHTNSINLLSSRGYQMEDIEAWFEKQKDSVSNAKYIDDVAHAFEDGRKKGIEEKLKEQKPIEWTELTWKDVNDLEEIMNEVHSDYRGGGIGQKSFGLEVLERFRYMKGDELDVKEQKPAEWSKEDEDMMDLLIKVLEVNHRNGYFKANEINTLDMRVVSTQELVSWLKSLKPQPKQEWSEEDREMRMKILKYLSTRCNVNEYEEVENWLNSLRP